MSENELVMYHNDGHPIGDCRVHIVPEPVDEHLIEGFYIHKLDWDCPCRPTAISAPDKGWQFTHHDVTH